MTSSNENIFRVTGHLCGEFTGPWWSQWRLMLTLICARINGWVNNIREPGDLRRYLSHYDVIVMNTLRARCGLLTSAYTVIWCSTLNIASSLDILFAINLYVSLISVFVLFNFYKTVSSREIKGSLLFFFTFMHSAKNNLVWIFHSFVNFTLQGAIFEVDKIPKL